MESFILKMAGHPCLLSAALFFNPRGPPLILFPPLSLFCESGWNTSDKSVTDETKLLRDTRQLTKDTEIRYFTIDQDDTADKIAIL
ncbi:Krueppel-like factor 5 [Fusarium oxysporum f. sp. albedinis]|nr:Krueppel-like factor 5 [Fusarium oxysporum f. sp. albedinis]